MSIRRATLILMLYGLSLTAIAIPASAQVSPSPDVSITCKKGLIEMDVYPGADYMADVECQAYNPTGYAETVRIQVSAQGLTYSAPGSIVVGSGGTETFPVTVRGLQRMEHDSRTLSITGYVDQFNGVANPNPQAREFSVIVNIKQYARIRVEAFEPFVQLGPRDDYFFEFKVHNDGNSRDKMVLLIPTQGDLEAEGFQVVLPAVSTEVDPQTYEKVRVQVRTPKKQGWTDRYFQLSLRATSDYDTKLRNSADSAENELQTITIYVRGIYLPGPSFVPSLVMMALAFAVVHRRRSEEIEDPPPDSLRSWR